MSPVFQNKSDTFKKWLKKWAKTPFFIMLFLKQPVILYILCFQVISV